MMNILKSLYYEFLSYFIPDKTGYMAKGTCLKCGKCCRYMYSQGTCSKFDFKIIQFLFPKYKRFQIAGKDEFGNFVFSCKLIGKDNLCTSYDSRLAICRKYPLFKYQNKGNFHLGCGFCVVPEKDFDKFLN
jgi:Fe-S-cluster containining protein